MGNSSLLQKESITDALVDRQDAASDSLDMTHHQSYNPQIIIKNVRRRIIKIMSIDISSLKKIIGDSTEVMIYGFSKCHYTSLVFDIPSESTNTIKTYKFDDLEYLAFDYKTNNPAYKDELRALCKASMTSILIENYKRAVAGQPIIPVIFCVGLTDNQTQKTLDVNRIIKTGNMTNAELRRCYKCLVDISPEIKKLAEQTFKFVNVVRTKINNQEHLSLREVPPFWNDSRWPQLWSDYTKKKAPSPKKDHPWRVVLAEKIAEIDASFNDKEAKSKRCKLQING